MRLKQETSLSFGHVLAPFHLPTLQAEAERIAREHKERPALEQISFKTRHATRTQHLYPLAHPRSAQTEAIDGVPAMTKETYEMLHENPKADMRLPRNLPPATKAGPYQAWSSTNPSEKAMEVPPRALVASRYLFREPVAGPAEDRTKRDTVLVFLHGNGFCKDLFLPLLDSILLSLGPEESANITEAWLLDTIGHGETRNLNRKEGRDEGYSNYDRLSDEVDGARDVIQFLSFFLPRYSHSASLPTALSPLAEAEVSQESKRDVILIGHSIGGTTSMQVAFQCPELIRSVVCMEPIIIPYEMAIFDAHPLPRWALRRPDRWPDRKTARAFFETDKFYRGWTPEAKDLFAEHGLRVEGGEVMLAADRVAEALGYHGTSNGFWIGDNFPLFPRQVDVLYVTSKDTFMLPEEMIRQLVGDHPAFTFAEVDAGHSLHLERPAECGTIIAKFLKSLVDKARL